MTLSNFILSAALIGGLSACSASEVSQLQANETTVQSDAPVAQSAAAAVEKAAPGFRATVKPGASVSLNSVLPKNMTSGTFQTVKLQLSDGYSQGMMSVKIVPSDGLSLFGGNTSKTFNMAAPGPHVWDVDVKADTDGVYFLNVFAEAQGQPRSFSVRLDMGVVTQKMLSDALPSEGELVDGGKIRVLEAEETIR